MTKSDRKQATWIWFPGDFEVWLHREVSIRREERGSIYPPFYRLVSPYMGVKPLEAGYARFLIEPKLGGLAWFEGAVPANKDDIHIYMDEKKITVRTGASPVVCFACRA